MAVESCVVNRLIFLIFVLGCIHIAPTGGVAHTRPRTAALPPHRRAALHSQQQVSATALRKFTRHSKES